MTEALLRPPCSCSWCTSLPPLQESWERLLASSKYNEQEGFAAVFQPFFYETALAPVLVSEEGGRDLHPLPLPPRLASPSPGCAISGKTLQHSLILS